MTAIDDSTLSPRAMQARGVEVRVQKTALLKRLIPAARILLHIDDNATDVDVLKRITEDVELRAFTESRGMKVREA